VNCEHEYKKTLAKNGMSFIMMCQKCRKQFPYAQTTVGDEEVTIVFPIEFEQFQKMIEQTTCLIEEEEENNGKN